MRAPSHSQHEQRLYLVASRVFTIVLIARVSARVQPTCRWLLRGPGAWTFCRSCTPVARPVAPFAVSEEERRGDCPDVLNERRKQPFVHVKCVG